MFLTQMTKDASFQQLTANLVHDCILSIYIIRLFNSSNPSIVPISDESQEELETQLKSIWETLVFNPA